MKDDFYSLQMLVEESVATEPWEGDIPWCELKRMIAEDDL